MIKKLQGQLRVSGRGFGLLLVKVLSGFILGLTFALVFRQLMNIGQLTFTFVIVMIVGFFIRLSSKWKFTGVLLFNLFCVMTALLLRMYLIVAPGQ